MEGYGPAERANPVYLKAGTERVELQWNPSPLRSVVNSSWYLDKSWKHSTLYEM